MLHEKQTQQSSFTLHVLIMIMTGVAAYGYLFLEAEESTWSIGFAASVIFQLGLMILGGWYCRTAARNIGESPVIIPLLVLIMLGSYVYEYIERWLYGVGHPFEFLVTCSLKNVLLASASAGCWIAYQRLAAIGGLFIMVFCLTICTHPSMIIISVVYVLVGTCWLLLSYWHQITIHLNRQERGKSPVYKTAIAGIILLLLVSTITVKNQEVVQSLQGFMPSSGGSDHHDHHARGGVGDGDALVAGKEHIQSFAPLEDAPFRSSEEPSLYDMFDDSYQDPACPVHQKKGDRAIALPPQISRQIPQVTSKSKQLNRTFSTLRKVSSQRQKGMKDLDSNAIMYVSGRTPLHLRMQTYEIFDGQDWHSQEWKKKEHHYEIKDVMGRSWLMIPPVSQSFNDAFCPEETHAVKAVNLHSNRIPAPLNLRGIHIDQLKDPEFYILAQQDVVALDRDKLPELTPIHVSSMVFKKEELRKMTVGHGVSNDINMIVPELPDMKKISALADSVTRDRNTSWEQIDAIIAHLRSEYMHDKNVLVSDLGMIERGEIPCAKFLFDTKKGPDYQFATAAVLMLRAKGFSARLVSGFYASPENYNKKSKHTEVYVRDTHFWVELYLGAGNWLTIEPTPGYEVLGPPPTFLQTVIASVIDFGMFLAVNVLYISFALITVSIIYIYNGKLIDLSMSLIWRFTTTRSLREYILSTQHLLKHRFQIYKMAPGKSETIPAWIKRVPFDEDSKSQLIEFGSLVDWAQYSPEVENEPKRMTRDDAINLLRNVVKNWSSTRIRKLKHETKVEASIQLKH